MIFYSTPDINPISNTSVSDLLFSLGFVDFDLVIYEFVIPSIGLVGLILCTISIWIFFVKKAFKNQIYDYYRFLVTVYWIHLLLSIPYGLFFTPRYFPSINSYPWAILQSFYITFSNFLCHLTGVIEIGILMDRMKNFSSFVKKYYMLSPRKNCLIFLIACILINIFIAFVYVPGYAGDYYYFDSNTGLKKQNSFFYVVITDFAASYEGLLLTIIVYVIRDLVTLTVGIILNILSFVQFKLYLKKKSNMQMQRNQVLESRSMPLEIITILTLNNSNETNVKREVHFLYMILTLCFNSIVSRIFLFSCNFYYLYVLDYVTLILGTVIDLVLVSVPASSFFVFYFFNKHFKNAFWKLFSNKKKSQPF